MKRSTDRILTTQREVPAFVMTVAKNGPKKLEKKLPAMSGRWSVWSRRDSNRKEFDDELLCQLHHRHSAWPRDGQNGLEREIRLFVRMANRRTRRVSQ